MIIPTQQSLFAGLPVPKEPAVTGKAQSGIFNARSGTFTDNLNLPVHRWFRYPAGFSAEWVEQVIDEFSPSTVLDPFAGSGTTLLAAAAAGVTAFGYESHPFVARIASAKTHWNCCSTEIVIEAATKLLQRASHQTKVEISGIPNLLTRCYTPEVLRHLYALRETYFILSKYLKPAISELLWLAITGILRPCSHVGTAPWQYVLPNKKKSKSLAPFEAFENQIAKMSSDMEAMKVRGGGVGATIIQHDARNLCENLSPNSIDMVITSPPYPNNYDYADATRLEMTFWGEIEGWSDLQETVRKFMIRSSSQHAAAEKLVLENLLAMPAVDCIREDLSAICHHLAEVRLTKGGKKAYHTMIAAYFLDLSKVFQSLRSVCMPGCTVCFVVGDSAPYGVYVPVEIWLGKLAVAAGFNSYSFEKLRDRNIKWKNRKHRVPLHEGRLWIKG